MYRDLVIGLKSPNLIKNWDVSQGKIHKILV